MLKNKLSPKYKIILVARYTLIMTCLMFLIGSMAAFNKVVATTVFICTFVVYVFLVTYYAKASYSNIIYIIDDNFVEFEKGVFFIKKSKVCLKNVQYIEVKQTFLQIVFGLCSVVFFMAGSKLVIQNLDKDVGITIASDLNKEIVHGI